MYLKRLHMHGFKSFANKTSLDFSPGITGIVGPNGSGKSNIADSLRWVLGEQSMRHLRGKKSEDVIFAGGRSRAALGMAEVTLTLDNSSGWLPSEFTEVTVTRRAFRSGESDYFINGTKTRLKDMLALLSQARIGHDSYTIIGQGLVDQALSARAEERRGLFEDAAGIRHFQVQRNDAEQRLGQTQTNLSRLHDILNEIEPRLGPLAEQARRAMEYVTTRSELDRLLRRWYGHQWRSARDAAGRAEVGESAASGALEQLRKHLSAQEQEHEQHRVARETLLRLLGDLRRQRGEITARLQGLERDLAVARERLASLDRAEQDLAGEQDQMRIAVQAAADQIARLTDEVAATEAAQSTGQAAIAALESAIHRARQRQEREDAQLRTAQRDQMQAQARLAAAQSEVTRLKRQREDRQTKLTTHQTNALQAADRARVAQDRLETLRTAHEGLRAELGDQLVARTSTQEAIATAQSELDEARSTLGEAQRERRSLADRLGLLREWAASQQEGAALLTACAALDAAERPELLGEMAELARIAPEREIALEAALGPFLHAIVAASEDDAWRAAQVAHDRGLGRVRIIWPTSDVANETATLAAQLDTTTNPAVRATVNVLLQGMRVVDADAPDALRWHLHTTPIVTARGEVAHPAGWLVTGQAVAEASESALARARELRTIPERVTTLEEQIRLFEGLVTNTRAVLEEQRATAQMIEKAIKSLEARLADQAKSLGQAQRDAEKLTGEAQIQQAVEGQLAAELVALDDEIAAADERYGEAHAAQRDLADALDGIQEEAAVAQSELRARQEELAQHRTTLAVKQNEAKSLAERLAIARDQQRDLAAQEDRRAGRLGELRQQRADVGSAIARYEQELAEARVVAQTLTRELQSHEADSSSHDHRASELEAALAAGRVELTQREADYRRALLEAQRTRDAVETLRGQMAEEMDEADLNAIVERDQVEGDPIPADEVTKTRRQIDSLRGRLKSLGGFDPEAPRAYEELKARYEFLTSQVRDMEEASARLRAVILELDQTMRRRFEETFHAVNERFQRHFVTLFQGGAARLELTAPRGTGSSGRNAKNEDPEGTADHSADEGEEGPAEIGVNKRGMTGGIEVIVQIPGKKVQDLTLLSGGERAMVSAALLFALLETNPPPFCLLDEVDAALDEANVVRFCEILKILASQTQFIVITHNRVTMTNTGTLYGVSMAESVSRILSMRMAEERSA